MAKVPRSTTVSVRIDQATAEVWRQQATSAGLSVSDWIRGAVDAGQQTHIPTPRKRPSRPPRDTSNHADPALMRQLAALGSNLNQVARALNECRSKGDRMPVLEALAYLRSIEAEAAKLLPRLPPPPKPKAKGDDDAH